MATLSKQVLEDIAAKMVDKSRLHMLFLHKQFQQLASAIYESQIPAPVMELFKTHCDYVETCTRIWLDGNGFNRLDIPIDKQLPSRNGSSGKITMTADIANQLIKAKSAYDKARENWKSLYDETLSALLALKTDKNIRENLPEAVPFLPPPMSNSLVVNFDSLHKKLAKQPQIKETAKK